MSIAHLLEALGIEAVPPVPSEAAPEGTDNGQTKQRCSLRSIRSPAKQVTAKAQRERIHPTLCQLQEPVDPDALLQDIAQTLQANPARLRRLLDADDLQDIAEGAISRAHLMAYFRLKRSGGQPLGDDTTEPIRRPESRPGQSERMRASKPSHDAMINHLMLCKCCFAPKNRYCTEGQQLRDDYYAAYERSKELPSSA